MDVVSVDTLVGEAESLAKAGRWPEALASWTAVRQQFPQDARGYRGASTALQALGRHREADAALEAGLAKQPDDFDMATDYAWLATRARNAVEALRRWELVLERYPDDAAGYIGFSVVLRDVRRTRLAEIVLRAARHRFPRSTRVAIDFARVAEVDERLEEALERWRAAMESFPNAFAGYVGTADVLRKLMRSDEAAEIIENAVAKFPQNEDLAFSYAAIPTYRGDWDEALRRWDLLVQRFPDSAEVARRAALGTGEVKLARRLRRLDQEAAEAANAPAKRATVAPAEGDVQPEIDLLEKFDNIGFDCEFGLVQRQLRLEPLSLLRWAGSYPTGLIRAFENDFEGLGDASRTTIEIRHGEYVYGSAEYGMILHTFIREADADRETLFKTLCQRMAFLRRKLLEDLEDPRKILVYKAPSNLTDDLLQRLYQATQKHGRNKLMVVKTEDVDVDESCRIEPLQERLVIGYRPAVPTGQDEWTLLRKSWVSLCAQALTHFGPA